MPRVAMPVVDGSCVGESSACGNGLFRLPDDLVAYPEKYKGWLNSVLITRELEGDVSLTGERKKRIIELLRDGANLLCEIGNDNKTVMQCICERVDGNPDNVFGEIVDSMLSNKQRGDDYDLSKYFELFPEELFKLIQDDEAKACLILEKVEINLEEYPVNAKGSTLLEWALQKHAARAARCIVGKMSTVLRSMIEQWKTPTGNIQQLANTHIFTDIRCVAMLLLDLWKKIDWGTGADDLQEKREFGEMAYRMLLKCPTLERIHSTLEIFKEANIDLSLGGSVLNVISIPGCFRLSKQTLLLILGSFNPKKLATRLGYHFFMSLADPWRCPYNDDDIRELCARIDGLVTDPHDKETLAKAGTKENVFGNNVHLTTTLKETRPKVAVYYRLYLGFKATACFFNDPHVRQYQDELMKKVYTQAQEMEHSTCFCLDRTDNGKPLTKLSGCAHVYHTECASQIRNGQCPQCRAPFVQQQNTRVIL